MEKYNLTGKSTKITGKHQIHWATYLEAGDRCFATIRHLTDGSLNRHRVPIIVVTNLKDQNKIVGYFDNIQKEIDYNELTSVESLNY